MAKPDDESKSDGLEILSVGSLYSGRWDKKYWSSSRGKDRYPYPIGYQARRTHQGVTYKMEIHEGSKGPIFQITSNDRQCASGETPDRAWANFQKKCCTRIKLWHGKRSSGKIDGVEFFGFKNVLVQRLLRELVATLNDASESSSLVTNFNDASAEGHDVAGRLTFKYPDLVPYLEKTRVTGKRSRTCRGIDMKSAFKYGAAKCQPQHQCANAQVLNDTLKKSDNDALVISYDTSDDLVVSHANTAGSPVLSNIDFGKNFSSSAHASPFMSLEASHSSKAEPCLAHVQKEVSSADTCPSDLPQEEKSAEGLNVSQLDRPSLEFKGLGFPLATEDGNEKAQAIGDLKDSRPPVPMNPQVHHDGDLCAPDTLDSEQETTFLPYSDNHRGEKSAANNQPPAAHMVLPEEPITGSNSEGSCLLNENSERSDFDSPGDDIAKSMLSLLLPQAIPLLTYASQKKRRRIKPSKDTSSGAKLGSESKGTIPSADVMSVAGALANSGTEGQLKTDVPSVYNDSMLESNRYVPDSFDNDQLDMSETNRYVPDSFDNDQLEDHIANRQLLSSDNAKAVAADLHKLKHVPDGIESTAVVDASEARSCHNQMKGPKKIFSHEELPKDFGEKCDKDGALVLHSAVGFSPSIPLNLTAKSKDNCLTTDDCSTPFDICSEKSNLVGALDCEGKINVRKRQSTPGNAPPEPSSVEVPLMRKYTAPLSESIICRNIDDNHVSETHLAVGNVTTPGSVPVTAADNSDMSKASDGSEGGLGEQISSLLNAKTHEALVPNGNQSALQDLALPCTFNKDAKDCTDGSAPDIGKSQVYKHMDKMGNQSHNSVNCSLDQRRGSCQKIASTVNQADINVNAWEKQEHRGDLEGIMRLIGCYSHPTRISSVMLTRKAEVIYICVSCGLLEEKTRDLFLYKIETKEPSLGRPHMVGHTSMNLPVLKDEFGREVAIDKSGLQFTPDARGLVLADSIRMPYCSEKNLHCLCSNCESCCPEENAVKIVKVKLGYVSLVLKLNTIHSVHCILVCEPHHLIALDESGRIYIWVMNLAWSAQEEVYVIPSYDFLPSRIVDLKRIPKSASMVVGHNGYGEFSLWDIFKRTVVSRFSAPASSVIDFIPISLFSWQTKSLSHDKPIMEDCVKKLLEAAMFWFSKLGEENSLCPTEEGDIAVWLYICTSSDSRALSNSYHLNLDGCWRLGLLIKNVVILGAELHPSTTAIGTSSGHGIIGTNKGHVCIWELATGTKLGTLHDFTGSGVSNIATDESTSSVAISGNGGQLVVYLHA